MSEAIVLRFSPSCTLRLSSPIGPAEGSSVSRLEQRFQFSNKGGTALSLAFGQQLTLRRISDLDEKEKRAIVADILKNAYRIRVLRAMCAHGGIPSFEGSGLQDDTCSHTRVDGWLQMRVSVMQDAYREICANPEVSLSFIEREISSDRKHY